MTKFIVEAVVIIGMLVVLEWRVLKKESRSTRVIYFSLLALSASIWVYLGASTTPLRPAVWLEELLAPVHLSNAK